MCWQQINFFSSFSSKDPCGSNVVNNISSDVLYLFTDSLESTKSYKIFLIDLCMQFSRYIKMQALSELRICSWLTLHQSSEPKISFELWSLVKPVFNSTALLNGLAVISCSSSLPVFMLNFDGDSVSVFSFFNLAATYSPTPSPVQYHRPFRS